MSDHPCIKCGSFTGYGAKPRFVCNQCITAASQWRPVHSPAAVQDVVVAEPTKALTDKPKSFPGRRQLVADFSPNGRSGLYIYAVVLKQHEDKVKIGMTKNWKNRRSAYAAWNLASVDAILEERVFCINEEFVDLAKLENHILVTFKFDRAHGKEWFHATLDDACQHIDNVMCRHNITYELQ